MSISVNPPPLEQTRRALDDLGGVSQNRLDWRVIPQAVRLVLSMIAATLQLRHIPDDKLPRRPRVRTLLTAGHAIARTKREFDTDTDKRMANAPVDVMRTLFLLTLIAGVRELAGYVVSFLNLLVRNLTVWEHEVHETVDGAYTAVEPLAKSDGELASALADVHDHLRGAAEQAVDTAKSNQQLRKEGEERGIQKGIRLAREEADKKQEQDTDDLIDTLLRIRGDKESRDRAPPR